MSSCAYVIDEMKETRDNDPYIKKKIFFVFECAVVSIDGAEVEYWQPTLRKTLMGRSTTHRQPLE